MVQAFQNTLKENKRYLTYEPADDKAVQEAFKLLFGIQAAAQAGILPVQIHKKKSILRVKHTYVNKLKAALVHTGKHSLKTSGTLKGARKALQ